MPSSRCSSAISSRICAWIVTSSAVVGSSAISTLRVAGERHGDHGALAHAARQLVRVFLDALLPARGCRPGAASRWPVARPPCATCPRAGISASPICWPMVITGLSEVIGSWKIIEISLPRIVAHLGFVETRRVAAVELDRAADDAAGRVGTSRIRDSAVIALAAAGLADDRQRLAAPQGEGHAVHRLHDALPQKEKQTTNLTK